MRFEKGGIVGRVEQVPGGRAIMGNYLSHDAMAGRAIVSICGQIDVDVVVSTTEQIALNTFAVALVERVVLVDKGNGESVQCNLLGCAYNDIHIDLTADRNDRTPCHSIVAEIIPHYRPPAWDLFDSPDYAAFLKTHPVKITGQSFYDDSHVACTKDGKAGFNPARNNAKDSERLALCELHPIYPTDDCKHTDKSQCNSADASAWFPFTDLQSRLGLASVTPTDRCKATTDNPKSACPGFAGPTKH